MYLPPPEKPKPAVEATADNGKQVQVEWIDAGAPSSGAGSGDSAPQMHCEELPKPAEDEGGNNFSSMMNASRTMIASVDRDLVINPALTQKKERFQWLNDCGSRWYSWRNHTLNKAQSRIESAAKGASSSQKTECALAIAQAWLNFMNATAKARDSVELASWHDPDVHAKVMAKFKEPIESVVHKKIEPAVAECIKQAPPGDSRAPTCENIARQAKALTEAK